MSLTAEILKEFEPSLDSVTLKPSSGGVFDVVLDGELLFSKDAAGRHAAAAEVLDLLRARLPSAPEDNG